MLSYGSIVPFTFTKCFATVGWLKSGYVVVVVFVHLSVPVKMKPPSSWQ